MVSGSQSAETNPYAGGSVTGSRAGQRRGTESKEMAPGTKRLGWELHSALSTGMLRRHWTLLYSS